MGVCVGLSLEFTMLYTLIFLFYMDDCRYDANQGNIQSHFLLSQRWMLEQDRRLVNNTGCISHPVSSLVLTASCVPMQWCCNASDLISLWIKQITQGWATGPQILQSFFFFFLILISVSIKLSVWLCSDNGYLLLLLFLCLELKSEEQKKEKTLK